MKEELFVLERYIKISGYFYIHPQKGTCHHFHRDHNAPCLPPKILHSHCFQSLPGISQSSQEKLKTMVMQNFGGVSKVHYGLCEISTIALMIEN